MSEENLAEPLTKKVGPLPGWAYVVIVAGGAWAVYLWRKNHGVSTGGQIQQTSGVAPDSSGIGWGGDGILPSLSAPGTVSTVNGTPGSTSNAQWARNVTDGLIAGGGDPPLISNAISKYLSGASLSSAEQSIVNKALVSYGSPPEGIVAVKGTTFQKFQKDDSNNALYGVQSDGTRVAFPTYQAFLDAGGNTNNVEHFQSLSGFTWDTQGGALNAMLKGGGNSAPASAQAPAPAPAGNLYTVKAGDSLSLIAQHYYGNMLRWPDIYNANRDKISNPNLIYPGQVLRIP